jgi:hypothetical protein
MSDTNDPNHFTAVGKAHGEHAATGLSEAIKSRLAFAVGDILSDNAAGSKNASCASTNATPCFRWFCASFVGSHSKLGLTAKSIADVWVSRHTVVWALAPAGL